MLKQQNTYQQKDMFKILEWITEAVGWLQIAASPFLIGVGIGAIIYFPNPTTARLVIGLLIGSVSLILGVVVATKIWKTKEGTIAFLSRIMAGSSKKKPDNNDETSKTR